MSMEITPKFSKITRVNIFLFVLASMCIVYVQTPVVYSQHVFA